MADPSPQPSPPARLEQTSCALTRLTGQTPALPERKRRRWGRWTLGAVVLLLALYGSLPWIIPVSWLVRAITEELSRQLSLGQPQPIAVTIDASRSSLSWGQGLVLANVKIGAIPGFGEEPLLTIARVQTDFSPLWYLVTRHLRQMVITEPVLRLVLDQGRRLNISALQPGPADLPALDILIVGGGVHLANPATGETMTAGLKRIHTEVDPFAAKARLSGEFLESLLVNGKMLIDPAETNPIKIAVDLNLPSLNPAAVLGGECKVGWDWVDLKKVHSERFLEVAKGTATRPAKAGPASSPEADPTWWRALSEGRIRGLSRANLVVKLLPDSRIHFSGKVEGKNLSLPGLTQDQLSAELEGTWDPITKALDLTSAQATGDGWGILPGTNFSFRPEADQSVSLLARAVLEPSRLAEVFGTALPLELHTRGRMEVTLELTRHMADDRWKLDVDLTPLAVQAEGTLNKSAGQPMSLSGTGAWQHGPGGLFNLEHVIFKAPGALATLDFVELPAAERFMQESSRQIELFQSRPQEDREPLRSAVRLAARMLGKLSTQTTWRVDSLEQMATWIVPLRDPVRRGQLAGGLALRASYQPVDVAEETGQVQINVESTTDRPLRIYDYVDKPAGRLLTAEAAWQVNPKTGWFSRFISELALGRARVRLGTDAAWQVNLDEDRETRELVLTGDIRLPVKFEGLEQWILACPVLQRQLSRQRLAGDAQADVLVRTQIGIRTDGPQPVWQVRALRVSTELDAEQLTLALNWSEGANGTKWDYLHLRDKVFKIAGDYRYLQNAEVPHQAWLAITLDGGQAEICSAWSETALDGQLHLDVHSVQGVLGQFPQLAKSLSGRNIAGSGAVRLSLQGTGPEKDRKYRAGLSADLTRIKLALPPEQLFKDDLVPLRLDAESEAVLRCGELSRLGANAKLTWDQASVEIKAAADLRGRDEPGGQEPLDLWLRYGPVQSAELAFDVDMRLSNALRAGIPPLGKLAAKYAFSGSAKLHGAWTGKSGEWTGALDLDLAEAGFAYRNWLRKRPGTPAGLSLPVVIAKQKPQEPATLNVIFGNLRLGSTRLDFSGGLSGSVSQTHLPNGLPSVTEIAVADARGMVLWDAPQIGEWAGLCPELADSKPQGALQGTLLASWSPKSVQVENLDLSCEHFQMDYAGSQVGFDGELSFSPKRLNIPHSQIIVGGQTVGILAEVDHPLDQPAGTVLLTAKSLDQRSFSKWLEEAEKRYKQTLAELTVPPAVAASQPGLIPMSADFFETNPSVYAPPFFVQLFNRVKDWRLTGELFVERAVIELTKQDGPKNADDVSLRWRIADGAFRMDFSASQSGGRVNGDLAFPLTEPNPIFHLSLNFRDLIWSHTSAHTRFPGLWLYGSEDRARAALQLESYDLPNPALAGVGSFYTILDSSTARLFGPGGAMFYEGPGNWHVGQGLMVFGPGYLLGPADQPNFAKIFPGLNTERMEIERVFNWYEKTKEGYQNDNMLFLSRTGNPLVPTYNFYAVGTTQKASTPDPLNPKYLIGNRVSYQIGLDLLGEPNENWKNEIVGRVPLFQKTGYLVPGSSEYWNPARGPYSPGKLVQEGIEFTPERLIRSLLWEAHPLRTAYQHALTQWEKWQESMKKK